MMNQPLLPDYHKLYGYVDCINVDAQIRLPALPEGFPSNIIAVLQQVERQMHFLSASMRRETLTYQFQRRSCKISSHQTLHDDGTASLKINFPMRQATPARVKTEIEEHACIVASFLNRLYVDTENKTIGFSLLTCPSEGADTRGCLAKKTGIALNNIQLHESCTDLLIVSVIPSLQSLSGCRKPVTIQLHRFDDDHGTPSIDYRLLFKY